MTTPPPATTATAPAPASRWKKVGKRLVVLALALLLAGLLAEGLVLVVLGEQVKFPRHVVGAPFGLRINQPGTAYRHKSPDVEVWFRINSQGLRADRDYPKEKPAGVKRIVTLGDSFTIGYEVDVEDCFSSVLERTLRERGHAVEVLNAGVSGYSNAEACLYLERELIQYDPDVVVLSFYTNDIQDNLRTELFRLDGSTLVPYHESYVPLGRLGTFLNTNPLLSFLSSYSNAFAFLKETLTREYKRDRGQEIRKEKKAELTDEHLPRPARVPRETAQAPPAPPRAQPAQTSPADPQTQPAQTSPAEPPASTPPAVETSPPVATAPTTETSPAPAPKVSETAPESVPADSENPLGLVGEMATYAKGLTGAILQRIYEDCRARGIPFVLQIIPHLGEDDAGNERLYTQFPFAFFDAEQPHLGFLDARAFLEPHLGKEQLYWLRSHRHWTPLSHELSGKALADLIEAQGFLEH
jgi:lysophospholipase L1-like esterase